MEIFKIVDEVRRHAHCDAEGYYKCFPKSCNIVKEARKFSDLRQAAVFLVANPDWGIRMQPGSAIEYKDIQILRR